ncbi:MAG TPA: hypothetical protein VGB85_28195 [Nannocystis sp.]
MPACQGPQADTSPFTTTPPLMTSAAMASSDASSGSTSGMGPSASSTTSDSSSTSSSSSEGASTTLIWDVGSGRDVGDGKPVGCKGKIDFLFVISRYGGMNWFQTQLLDAFPKFIDTITSKFADFDYHIMVVHADEYWGLSYCDDQCPTPAEEPCGLKDYPCYYTPTHCDTQLGAGEVFPAGGKAANKLCPIDGGRRYMIKGQTDLESTFACAAQVGVSGDMRMGQAMARAVQPWMNDEGSCNDGFLREEALLMVTLITNAYDQEDGAASSQVGTPATWADAVREAKHGDLDSVVMLGIIPTEGPGCKEIDRLCQMLEMFPFALNRDSWTDNYGPFFEEAAGLVETACADFIPPG